MSPSSDASKLPDPQAYQQLMNGAAAPLSKAFELAAQGVSSHIHSLNENVTFILDNSEEVTLRVIEIDIEHAEGKALALRIQARTDFKNVLVLAKKLNMKIGAFSTYFTVILNADPEFMELYNDQIVTLDQPAKFFETLDEIKRPIFLNLNHYVIARISD
ncbi:hypothetical protein COW36_21975 [bacterium (Candidatus Blackallbacteria) CG17_big_fil_post_rev_8_21_14_2_50_48_46]|uniref:Uncharacterized protein n=1 Tax=bacterium (Candidatus Blackallbacteria) CG17_big_fil_post_rev_8_21_14_2_50_48_46 TaxID=2014261 RepID=A0A2M7FY85_9BACT|nr:MAG: hypothetical protein COW64_13405 [bacterium (Candidatus Blackallbacteria) CG18_big_fil_WC_8_21_14_2_50_49_26]PIW14287.1 MAG: hypothetical protein COW36_21975 [bacterium (Candidatus Blackallbacteria) CG17_big_fil_post_rev_8_21_14_2_50_48_46]PIW45556.1 MAG: hypothetical protein COW20_19580 [bacterium (Candidatus Blackallbacteria) CG13_big_fil_rev_8_21_14_2_50_49_14]